MGLRGKLHQDYLCNQCQMFHPCELDTFFKNQIKSIIRDYPESHKRLEDQIVMWRHMARIATEKLGIENDLV